MPAGGRQVEVVSPQPQREAYAFSPIRTFAFSLGAAVVFLRVSMFHQTTTYLTHVNLRLLYVVGIPALAGVILAGGIQSAFRGRPAVYWVGFTFWMILAVPFSAWKGGSTTLLLGYLRGDLTLLFIVGGLALTWRECKVMMSAAALGTAAAVLCARIFTRESSAGYRTGLEFGTVNDPNDFAAHLLFALPFLLWVVFTSRSTVLRAAAMVGIGVGLYSILGSASRGGLLGLIGAGLFLLWRGTTRQRIAFLLLAPVAALGLAIVVPPRALRRITTFSASGASGPEAEEAIESAEDRRYLLKTSITYAIQHPIVGVGPGQFAEYEGKHSLVVGGRRGMWRSAHNSFTCTAAECGIPAFICYLAAIVSTFRLLSGVFREAQARPGFGDIRATAFCIQMSMVGFCIAIFFLNFAYFFYLPMLSGLAIAVSAAAKEEFQFRGHAAWESGNIGTSAGAGWRAPTWTQPPASGGPTPAPRMPLAYFSLQ